MKLGHARSLSSALISGVMHRAGSGSDYDWYSHRQRSTNGVYQSEGQIGGSGHHESPHYQRIEHRASHRRTAF